MAADRGVTLAQLAADPALAESIDLRRYVSDSVGMPTLRDIMEELKKPGRDPRRQFQTASFRDDIREITDLQEGMILQGVVTNVTAFGAFVNIGVHQDGLVHVSHLAHRYVKDPGDAVTVGQVVKVKVLSADVQRKRIALSIKEAEAGGDTSQRGPKPTVGAQEAKAGLDLSTIEKAGFRIKRK
jgi:uncharacterized protein